MLVLCVYVCGHISSLARVRMLIVNASITNATQTFLCTFEFSRSPSSGKVRDSHFVSRVIVLLCPILPT